MQERILTDEELVAVSRLEDPFVAFYRAEYPTAVRLAYVLTCSTEQAQDVSQEAFARVITRFSSLDNPAAYLRVTLVNLSREAHRRRSRETYQLNRLARPTSREDPAPVELLDVLSRLPERHRTVLILRYWADWSEVEIASAIRCRPGTVKSIASRGLAKLKKELSNE
jgi:RNA polymerase sigma factor (sigma-70 family)